MPSLPPVLPYSEDAEQMTRLYSNMRLFDYHECDGGDCRFYLAKREHGSYHLLIFNQSLAEGQLLLERDTETPAQAFQRRIESWRQSHHCYSCQLCTTKGGANDGPAIEPVTQAAPRTDSAEHAARHPFGQVVP